MNSSDQLKKRLEKIWQSADFTHFFKKFAKRSPLIIKKGNNIFYEGDVPDRLYFIKEGYVKLYHHSEEGKDTIAYLYGPGSILGIRALTSKDQRLKHNAKAITDVEIITLSRKDYIEILAEYPEFLIDLLHTFIARLNYTERKLEGFIAVDATSRVANFLISCAERFGKKQKEKTVIPIPLTHQLIADFVGSVRETVTLAMRKLEKEKILEGKRGEIRIFDLKKLNHYTSTF